MPRNCSTNGAPAAPKEDWTRDDGAFDDVREQFRAYFAHELQSFTLPLAALSYALEGGAAAFDAVVSSEPRHDAGHSRGKCDGWRGEGVHPRREY